MRLLPFPLAVVLLAGACAHPTECDLQTMKVDVIYGDSQERANQGVVDAAKNQLWKCDPQPINNSSGTRIGTAYTCSICR